MLKYSKMCCYFLPPPCISGYPDIKQCLEDIDFLDGPCVVRHLYYFACTFFLFLNKYLIYLYKIKHSILVLITFEVSS